MILKTEAKVKPAGLMHWSCVTAKQVVFKCSDVATFHQNLALGKVATLLSQRARQEQVYTFHIKKRDTDGSSFAYCQCFVITVMLLVIIFCFHCQ